MHCVDYYGIPKAEVVARHIMLYLGEAKRFHTTGEGRLMFSLPLHVNPLDVASALHKQLGDIVDIKSLKSIHVYLVSIPVKQARP